jgi:predicted dehydrogenase
MQNPKKYRVAVIGRTGKGAYGHGLDVVWLKHPRAEIVAVADENEAGRKAAMQRLGISKSYADLAEMLKQEKPEIVSVADRWLDQHREMVLACANQGCHLFLEKPVARNLLEADEMVAACDRHHVKCAIAHQTRYSPKLKVIRELLQSGQLGDLLELNGYGKCDQRGGGEDLMVLGTHTMDLMRFLAGEASRASARIFAKGKPAIPGDMKQLGEGIGLGVGDHILATYEFANGVIGRFTTFLAKKGDKPGARYWLEIRGTKGVIHVGYGAMPTAAICEDPSWLANPATAKWQPISSNGIGKPETVQVADNGNRLIVDDLIEAIEQDRPPLGSIHDGRAALEMILAVYESHKTGRVVDLPLKNRKHPLSDWR